MAKRVYIETYGCQMNVADSGLVGRILTDGGYRLAVRPEDADVILMNTCAVRERAEERVFGRSTDFIRHKHRDPDVVIGILGCMGEHLREKIVQRAPHIDLVVGPDAYRRLPEILGRLNDSNDPLIDVRLDKRESYEGLGVPTGDGVSAFITVQRGCDKFCAFCIVPFVRGRERGTPPREVLRQVRALAAEGYKEVSLLGQTVNSYRWEDVDFADLLTAVAQVDGIERVRFTSPYPVDFSPKLIATMAAEPKICQHVHLPVQSGADSVLARMGRGHTVAEYRTLVAAMREAMPEIAITTDIIVGFCDETEAEHQATLDLVSEMRFDSAFMFKYSERPGTPASKEMPDTIPEAVKNARLQQVIAIQEQVSAERHAAEVGRRREVLVVGASKRNPDVLFGRTDTFKKVLLRRDGHQPGALVTLRIASATSHTLMAEGCVFTPPAPQVEAPATG